jgi:16S rRNA (cytosine967-C5)-methyltransferase
VSARRAAAELLVAVLDEGRTLADALAQVQAFAALSGRDRAFARAIATTALRRLGGIDAVLAQFLQKPLPETAAHGRAMLRVGAAQILAMGAPHHAAVGETVAAANAMRQSRGFAKLINAVLRKVAADGSSVFAAQPPGTDLPAWLFTRWRASFGAETANALALALRDEPALDFSVKTDAAAWAAQLEAQITPTGSLRVANSAPIEALAGFGEGAWWVQDAAAALPARLLGEVAGQNVLDLCAAPGGKTLQLAAAGAKVTAVDRSAARLERLRANLSRTGLDAKILARDALELRVKTAFDAVLLDAPCSSTGVLRRRPDVAWLRRPSDIRTLSELQMQLLGAARAMVKPGGALVYAVCSLEPEEGPAIAQHAITHGWTRKPIAQGEIAGADDFITPEGDLRTLPSHWRKIGGLDGFYAVRLLRSSAA